MVQRAASNRENTEMKNYKKIALGAAAAALALGGAATWTALAQDSRVIEDHSWCEQMLERNEDDNNKFWACEVREMVFDLDGDVVRASASPNGGISARPGDGDEIRLIAKIGAQAPTEDEAQSMIEEISIGRVDGVITSFGPEQVDDDDRSWWVSFELEVPAYSALELSSVNGGIDLSGIKGDLDAKTVNGGIDIDDCSGTIVAETVNGGIDVAYDVGARLGGPVDLSTTNGGVNLVLPAGANADLDLTTHMGTIDVAEAFEASQRSNRHMQGTLGEGGPMITISTHLGGIVVSTGDE